MAVEPAVAAHPLSGPGEFRSAPSTDRGSMHPAVAAANTLRSVHRTGQIPDYEDILTQGYGRLLKPGDVAIDVGCHAGRHLEHFVDLVGPEGHVHAFEPIPFLMENLRARFGALPEVTLHPCALSAEAGETDFTVASALGESGLRPRHFSQPTVTARTIRVRVETLDAVLGAVPAVAFLKLDIEGGDLDCLTGGQRLLARCRPFVSIEYGWAGYSVYGHSQRSLFDAATAAGYVCADLIGNLVEDLPTWLQVSDTVTWDFFLVPLERRAEWSAAFAHD